ncbi:MAG: aminopeptidase [Bacteroidales bacterium]|jgi:bleomycin hydrolase|nr:aminopeptidase [Bacteroidales bacterium]
MRKVFVLAVALTIGSMSAVVRAQDSIAYKFTDVKRLPATSIKSQDRAGTCWSWSTISYLESEMIRLGKDSVSLSPMYIVWNTYDEKAKKYVRMQGNMNFGQGGAFADVIWVIKNFGIVPLSEYSGLQYGTDVHTHGELDGVLSAYLKVIVSNPNKKLSTAWLKGYEGILNAYLGEKPTEFTYKGKKYSPMSFYKEATGLNMDDYVSLTSFTHHPFYTKFAIEVPDNWIGEQSYNIPLDELMSIMDKSIDNGYTFAWGSDVSEEGFARKGSIAIVPDYETVEMADAEISKWTKLTSAQKINEFLKNPGKEKTIDQKMRQEAFDNFQTTDDHGMHVIGKAKDQNGNMYFIVKNSWGEYGEYKGYFYASYPFAAYKTLNIVIHKDALPKDLKKKLGIQ